MSTVSTIKSKFVVLSKIQMLYTSDLRRSSRGLCRLSLTRSSELEEHEERIPKSFKEAE